MLTPKQVTSLREQLATAKNPLFLFDDDPDGLCSFLLFYKLHREGHGTVIKALPKIDPRFLRKVEEYHPDKIFILDIPMVDQEFIDQAKTPITWVDHHEPLERRKVDYFNPRITQPGLYIPTTRLAYQINPDPDSLWIAMVGCLGDYHLPDFQPVFLEKYPKLMTKTKDIDKIIYESPIGKLVRLFSFLLKGKTSEVNKSIKILTRIRSPNEILNQESSQGKYLYKRFEQVDQKYKLILSKAKKIKTKERLLVFVYDEQSWSFTSELAAELLHRNQSKIVIVARKKSGAMKCSLRSKKILIPPLLEKALIGIEGYGGGHELACGANIQEPDWKQFLDNLKRELESL